MSVGAWVGAWVSVGACVALVRGRRVGVGVGENKYIYKCCTKLFTQSQVLFLF